MVRSSFVLIIRQKQPILHISSHIEKYPQIWTSASKHAESRVADFCYLKKTQKSISLSRATTRWLVLLLQPLLQLKRQWSNPYKSTLSELRSAWSEVLFLPEIRFQNHFLNSGYFVVCLRLLIYQLLWRFCSTLLTDMYIFFERCVKHFYAAFLFPSSVFLICQYRRSFNVTEKIKNQQIYI